MLNDLSIIVGKRYQFVVILLNHIRLWCMSNSEVQLGAARNQKELSDVVVKTNHI